MIDQAGGNPGILLTAAAIGTQLRTEGPSFLGQVGRALERKARETLGTEAIDWLRLLSVLTYVGYRGQAANELKFICRAFGDATELNQIINQIPQFENAGFVRTVGYYAQVVPPLFGNYLAAASFRGRAAELAALMTELHETARVRLLKRLAALGSDVASGFWDSLFGGGLRSLEAALENPELLRLVSPAVPDRLSRVILPGLEAMSLENRLRIDGTPRRQLMWALEELLFRRRTSESALRSIALLAEAETETFGNNATGVFKECFYPLHPQCPLPLTGRLAILREALRPELAQE